MLNTLRGYSPAELSSLLNARVLEEHADEAAFLWALRGRAAFAPHFDLEQLALLDERIVAHLQGLCVAAGTGLQLAMRALGSIDAGTLFTAAWLAWRLQEPEAMRATLSIAASDPALAAPFVSALSWLEPVPLMPLLRRLSASTSAAHRALAFDVLVAGHAANRDDAARALEAPDAGLRARAARAVGELGLMDMLAALERATADRDPACRFWAHWSRALRAGAPAAEQALEAADAADLRGPALDIAMRTGEPGWARSVIRCLAQEPGRQREAIAAMGAFGDPATVPWLLRLCEDGALACAAAEAIATITGVDLEAPELRRDAPEPAEGEGEGEPLHPEDRDARWADAAALAVWWRDEQGRFRAGARYLAGQPVSEAAALQLLRAGTQRQRRGAALELARLRPGMPVFHVAARADWQQRRLAR